MNIAAIIKPVALSFSLVACLVVNSLAAVEYTLHKSVNPSADEQDAY